MAGTGAFAANLCASCDLGICWKPARAGGRCAFDRRRKTSSALAELLRKKEVWGGLDPAKGRATGEGRRGDVGMDRGAGNGAAGWVIQCQKPGAPGSNSGAECRLNRGPGRCVQRPGCSEFSFWSLESAGQGPSETGWLHLSFWRNCINCQDWLYLNNHPVSVIFRNWQKWLNVRRSGQVG